VSLDLKSGRRYRGCVKRWLKCFCLAAFVVLAFPFRSPAPLIYRPGEGWSYELAGGEGDWLRPRAKDQLQVAQAAYDKKDYSLARKAARHVVNVWPLSDYAPQAEYLLARCHEATGDDEMAFNDYQTLLQKYPKSANYGEILERQFAICNRFLDGERFKLWNYLPTFPSMDKTVGLYEKLIKNGPYSDVAPQAQLNIGTAQERKTRFFNDNEPYVQASKAYQLAADRYHDRPNIASEALFRQGLATDKQAKTAEYDQTAAGDAIDVFIDFMTRYPDDPRVKDAQKMIDQLKAEQARGNFEIARYYDSKRQWRGARVYYNEVVSKNPDSPYKDTCLQRIATLNELIAKSGK
jgi:outer membrane assembly lipoprotein YfiO